MSWLWTPLINGVFAGCVLTVVAGLGMTLAGRRGWNAATRYVVWSLVLVAVLLLPLRYIPRRSASPVGFDAPVTSSVVNGISGKSMSVAPDAPLERSPADAEDRTEHWSGFAIPAEVIAGSWSLWLLGGWIGIAGLLLLRIGIGYTLLEGVKRRALDLPASQNRVKQWLNRCGSERGGVRVAISAEVAAPVAAGPLRPCILIPATLLKDLEAADLDPIGLHESAHLARRDDWMLFAERVFEAVFFFHPAVRWITRRLDLEREIACDDIVVRSADDARAYAACLTRVMEASGGVEPPRLAASSLGRLSRFERRVELLLDRRSNMPTAVLKSRVIVSMAAVSLLLWTAAAAPGIVVVAAPEEVLLPPVPGPAPAPAMARPPAATAAVAATKRIKPQAPAPAPPAVVRVPVVVTDSLGRYVSGLESGHFSLFQDLEPQNITEFSGTGPLSLAVVSAIRGAAAEGVVNEATTRMRRDASPDDEFRIFREQDPPPLTAQIAAAAQSLNSAAHRRRIILVLSDGSGRADSAAQDEIIAAANAVNAQIYALSITPLYPGRVSALDEIAIPALLDNVAEQTGGRHYAIAAVSDTADVLTRIAVTVRNTYLLGFQPAASTGTYRRISVSLSPPRGIQRLNAHNPPGYFAGR